MAITKLASSLFELSIADYFVSVTDYSLTDFCADHDLSPEDTVTLYLFTADANSYCELCDSANSYMARVLDLDTAEFCLTHLPYNTVTAILQHLAS